MIWQRSPCPTFPLCEFMRIYARWVEYTNHPKCQIVSEWISSEMEEGDKPRSLADLKAVAEDFRRRSFRNLFITFVVMVVSVSVLFGVSLPENIQGLLGAVLVVSGFGFLASISSIVAALRNDITRLPYSFSEKLRLSLYELVNDLNTYAECTTPKAKKQRGSIVRKRLITVSNIVGTWGGTFETGNKENLDLLTEDLNALSETLNDLLQRINYLVKRNEKVYDIAIEAMSVLAGGLERHKNVRPYVEVFADRANWVAGQGRGMIDPEFAFSLGSFVGERLGVFYRKSRAEIVTIFALVDVGLLYGITVLTCIQFLSMNLDDNFIFMGFITACSAVGIPLYISLKRR